MHVLFLIFERARSGPSLRDGLGPAHARSQKRPGSPCASDLALVGALGGRSQGHAARRLASSGGSGWLLRLHFDEDADADQCGNEHHGANCVWGGT